MFFIGNECIKQLNEMTKLDDKTSSSYWDHYHSDFHFDGQNFSGIKMLGDSYYNSLAKKYYSIKPPFFHNYDGPVRHRLVRLL